MGIHKGHSSGTVTNDALLTEDEAARVLHIQPATLATWRVRGRPHLPFVRVGRCVRYRQQDLVAFIEGHLSGSTEPGQA